MPYETETDNIQSFDQKPPGFYINGNKFLKNNLRQANFPAQIPSLSEKMPKTPMEKNLVLDRTASPQPKFPKNILGSLESTEL